MGTSDKRRISNRVWKLSVSLDEAGKSNTITSKPLRTTIVFDAEVLIRIAVYMLWPRAVTNIYENVYYGKFCGYLIGKMIDVY